MSRRMDAATTDGLRTGTVMYGNRIKTNRVRLRRYSRFVHFLKIFLPMTGCVLVALLFAWPTLQELQAETRITDPGQSQLVNARFFGRDRGDLPFSIAATQVDQDATTPDIALLTRPTAEWTQASGSWVAMTALHGRYNQATGHLTLTDQVHVNRDDGLEFETAVAEVDTKAGTAFGNAKVVGVGPTGEINAAGFRIYDHGERIVFDKASTAKITARRQTNDQ